MGFLTPLFIIGYIIWMLTLLYYFGATAQWFFESRDWWVMFVAFPVGWIVSMFPGGTLAICGLIFYYMVWIDDWNIFLATAFVFPGVAYTALAMVGLGGTALLEKIRGR